MIVVISQLVVVGRGTKWVQCCLSMLDRTGLLGSKARHSVKHPHRGLRRSQRYRFSAVCGGAEARGARDGDLSWAPPSPVNINTGSGRPRLRIDIRRGEITTLNIYEALVSRIKIRLFQVINSKGIRQGLIRRLVTDQCLPVMRVAYEKVCNQYWHNRLVRLESIALFVVIVRGIYLQRTCIVNLARNILR